MAFDTTATLLATRIEEAPSTVWIWDSRTSELHTVLMFHANVASVVWHPAAVQGLLVTCEGDQYRGHGFVWGPLSGPPRAANFAGQFPLQSAGGLPVGQSSGKFRPMWLDANALPLSLFYSDGCEFAVATLDEDNGDLPPQPLPWAEASTNPLPSFLPVEEWTAGDGRREESPLELVPAEIDSGENSELEDTFHYKRED